MKKEKKEKLLEEALSKAFSPENKSTLPLFNSEIDNIKKICDEVLGASNYRNTILVRRRIKSLNSQFASNGLYSLNVGFEYVIVYAKSSDFLMKALRVKKENISHKGRWDVFWSNADRPTMRYEVLGFTPKTGQWRTSKEKAEIAIKNYEKYQKEFESKITLEEYAKKLVLQSSLEGLAMEEVKMEVYNIGLHLLTRCFEQVIG